MAMTSTLPAVSVIIPLYNAEKYIGECLESILMQTFQDFEVIIVDDCSTDNSVAVVEIYTKKFGDRLKLLKTSANSGSPGVPGNMGVRFSRGEYLLILDDDDVITSDALEKLYYTAKDFDADVVACEKFYNIPEKIWYDEEALSQIQPHSYQRGGFVDKPTLIEPDLSQRIIDCTNIRFLWNIWSKLIRRDFIVKNDLYFTDNLIQDMIFTCCLIFTAERYVRVPYVINYYRLIEDSLSHKDDSIYNYLSKYLRALNKGFDYMDKFLSSKPIFQQQLYLKYEALNICAAECMEYFVKIYEKVPVYLIYEAFKQELAKENFSPSLTAFILNNANLYALQWSQTQEQFKEFAAQAQRRIVELEAEVNRLKNRE